VTRKKSQTKKNRNSRNSNTLRIIGGEWRSRKLPFVDALDNKADVLHNDALNFLSAINKPKKPYDIVFLDPPYRQGLIEKSLTYLNTEDLIDKDTLLYIEHESEEQINWDDYNLNVLKQTTFDSNSCLFCE